MVRVFLFALLAAASVPAQDTIHTRSNVVIVPALVKNAKGEAVYGLGAKDFVVEDDGVEQAVRLDEAAVRIGDFAGDCDSAGPAGEL
ncbi:MAG: hypothetical protein WA254_20870 [Candidatus Sulfotelmatobacter sp.]